LGNDKFDGPATGLGHSLVKALAATNSEVCRAAAHFIHEEDRAKSCEGALIARSLTIT
jgi:hypothetical protein